VKFNITLGRRYHPVLRIEVNQGGESLADFTLKVRAEAGGVVSEARVPDAEPRARIDDDVIALRKIRVRLLPVERRDVCVAALGPVVVNHFAAFERLQVASRRRGRVAD